MSNSNYIDDYMQDVVKAVVVSDDSHHIVEVTRKFCDVLGYKSDDLIGRTVDGLLPQRAKAHHDGWVEKYLSHEDGQQTRQMGGLENGAIVDANGNELPAELGLTRLRNSHTMVSVKLK